MAMSSGGAELSQYVALKDYSEGPEFSYLDRQVKVVLRNCGFMDPDSVEEYEARDGYKAIQKALKEIDACRRDPDGTGLRPQGAGRWRLPHGHEVEVRCRLRQRHQIHDLQRRRG